MDYPVWGNISCWKVGLFCWISRFTLSLEGAQAISKILCSSYLGALGRGPEMLPARAEDG